MSSDCSQINQLSVCQSSDTPISIFPFNEKLEQSDCSVQFILITDPICSTAWSYNGELLKLLLEYGHAINWSVLMGGLLPSWNDFDRGGIKLPADVFGHWQEVGLKNNAPIDGALWNSNPVRSSYPANKAVICGFKQSPIKGLRLLRALSEGVFVFNENISRLEVLTQKVRTSGLDVKQFLHDYKWHASDQLKTELTISESFEVKWLPSVIMCDQAGRYLKLEANLDYECLESMVLSLDSSIEKRPIALSILELLDLLGNLSTKEVCVLTGVSLARAEQQLHTFYEQGLLEKLSFHTGDYWIKKG